jgi:hypothetical protein
MTVAYQDQDNADLLAFIKAQADRTRLVSALGNWLSNFLRSWTGQARGRSVPGYVYSKAHKASGIVWDKATFATYIRDPRKAVPGPTMPFSGLKSDQEIADLDGFSADRQRVH